MTCTRNPLYSAGPGSLGGGGGRGRASNLMKSALEKQFDMFTRWVSVVP